LSGNRKLTVGKFVEFPLVKEWYTELSRNRKTTADLYAQAVYSYWNSSIKTLGFATVDQWLSDIKLEQKSEDIKTKRRWATNLLHFFDTYKSARTGQPLTTATRTVWVSAIKSFLLFHLGELAEPSKWVLSSADQQRAEQIEKEETKPLEMDEIKRLYSECRTKRDRAIFLTFMSGFGMAEWLQFSSQWFRYYPSIKTKSIPTKVTVKRQKTGVTYAVFLWDDAVNALAELVDDRERELGRALAESDALFINQFGKPVKDFVVSNMIRELADRSGVDPSVEGKVSYRVRPHEVGRDTFKTQCALARIPDDVSEYLIGHEIDQYQYNRFHKTTDGQKIIVQEVSKLRPVLNIVTGRGTEPTTGTRECCRLAATLAIQLHISEDEAHTRMANDLYRNHREVLDKVLGRIQQLPTQEAKLAEAGKGHYPHLANLTHEEAVMVAVEVASAGQSNGTKYEVRKIAATDEDGYALAVAEGFTEAGKVNGTVILRREART
jgi:integrase